MKILKFGGSSVGTPDRIEKVIKIVSGAVLREQSQLAQAGPRYPLAVVVSAFQGVTDTLINLARLACHADESYRLELEKLEQRHLDAVHHLTPAANRSSVLANVKVLINELEDILQGVFLVRELTRRTQDLIMSFGERLSAYIISESFKSRSLEAQFLDARKVVVTDDAFGNARSLDYTHDRIRDYFASHSALQVITGFIGATAANETTTLGRGGSDYTASIFGAALNAAEVEIWTDVNGMLTADPAKVKKAFSLERVTFDEAMELCHFGAKVIYPPTIQPALNRGIPIRILNTFEPSFPGTLISSESSKHGFPVTGVTSISKIALLLVEGSGMVGISGVSSRIFGALGRRGINVVLITQASSEHTICFAVEPAAAQLAKETIEEEFLLERNSNYLSPVRVEDDLSVVSVIGENMRHTPGIAATLFSALGRNGINVVAIAQGSSELNISVVIRKTDEVKALNAIHDAFFLSGTRSVNLYVAGTGLIGKAMLKQLSAQQRVLQETLSLELKLVGLSNRKKMLLSPSGISFRDALSLLEEKGEKADIERFVSQMQIDNLPSSIFVDCTASEEVVDRYEQVLSSSIAVVTPNKKAQSGDLERYRKIKQLQRRRRIDFFYETSVGAGLPIINTLNDLVWSGDSIERIEAVLSGTISFIMNTLEGSKKFSEIVAEAKERGLTEPDPRDDLNGLDVARKLIILAREVGVELSMSDVAVESLVPAGAAAAPSVEEFFKLLPGADAEWEERRLKASSGQRKLCYAASLDCSLAGGCKAEVKLLEIGPAHPFYSLSGSDNIVSFTTRRYQTRPLVVKGPGAGAEVTAAGVFADVLRAARNL